MLTPYADVEFADGKIIYTIDYRSRTYMPSLSPKMYDKNYFEIRRTSHNLPSEPMHIKENLSSIRAYVNSETVALRTDEIANDFLKLCVLLTIIDNELSEHATDQIIELKKNESREIQNNAKLVFRLQNLYKEEL